MRARLVVSAVAAVALALAFPKVGAAWLAPIGAAALFWAWDGASWKRCFGLGWFAGLIFYTISFWWWSTTIKSEVGSLAYVAVVAGAALEAVAVGAAGALAAVVIRRAPSSVAPLGVAAAFAAPSGFARSEPSARRLRNSDIRRPARRFAPLRPTSAQMVSRSCCAWSPLTRLSPFAAAPGARSQYRPLQRSLRSRSHGLRGRRARSRNRQFRWRPFKATSRNRSSGSRRPSPSLSVGYTALTRSALKAKPRLIVWPETVITTLGLNRNVLLQRQFSVLAAQSNATIVAGRHRSPPRRYQCKRAVLVFGLGHTSDIRKAPAGSVC